MIWLSVTTASQMTHANHSKIASHATLKFIPITRDRNKRVLAASTTTPRKKTLAGSVNSLIGDMKTGLARKKRIG